MFEYLGSIFTTDEKIDMGTANKAANAKNTDYSLPKVIYGKKELTKEN